MTSATEPGVGAQTQGGAQESLPKERASARAWYALVALIIAMLFAFVTRQILTLSAEAIKVDLSLSDLQIGETTGLTPAIFVLIAMYPLAWLADRFERRTVLAVCVVFWSIMTAASGLAIDFTTLLACSVAIVVGEAGLSPVVYSLIPDLFPKKSVPRANIIAYGASVIGVGIALALGGMLIGGVDDLRPLLPAWLQGYETWRLAFFLVAVPGPLVALAVFMIGRTRREVVTAQGPAPLAPMGPYLKQHGLVALGVFGTMGVFNLALQAVGDWLPIAIIRIFEVDASSAGIHFGLSFMAGAAVGLVTAALTTPYWRRLAGTAYVLRAISFSAAATAVPVLLLGFVTEVWQAYALVALWSASFVTGVSLMPGMMQDVAPSALRTRVIAAGTVVFMLLGGAGAPIVGFISDQLSGDPRGLIWAIVGVALTGFVACAALARFVESPFRRTVADIAENEQGA